MRIIQKNRERGNKQRRNSHYIGTRESKKHGMYNEYKVCKWIMNKIVNGNKPRLDGYLS